MHLGIFINTPAQAHFFKNIVMTLEKKGHTIEILVRDYGETLSVLNGLGLKYNLYANSPENKIVKILELPIDILKANNLLKRNKPRMLVGFGGQESYSAFTLRCPSIVFQDSEPHINLAYMIQYKMFMPFVSSLITTKTFSDNLGKKHIKIDSYKELAYLHPKYFLPDEKILNLLNINKNEHFVLIRFNAFNAVHDTGMNSFTLKQKIQLIHELEKYARIFVSAESKLPKGLEKYVINIPKHKIHDCLYFANLLVTDTQTMTTEAGILGTPVVRCNSFVGPNDMGNFIELENKYKLIFNFRNPSQAIEKAVTLIQNPNIKSEWKEKRQKLLQDKINITEFMVWYIENYPDSFKQIKNNPELKNKYRL